MKAKYIGTNTDQVKWGSNDDPRGLLEEGKEYEVVGLEVHSWHTKIILTDYPKLRFNGAGFEYSGAEQSNAINAWQDNHRRIEGKLPFIYYPQ